MKTIRFSSRIFFGVIFLQLIMVFGFVRAQTLCEPGYGTGCSQGDGFTDFAVAEIENYGSGCANLNGNGWSQYLGLGPAFLIPGQSYDFIMKTGYNNQNVSIWIDFNDDLDLTEDERILFDFNLSQSGQFYTAVVEIPLTAPEGQHIMRARTNWSSSCDDPCEDYSYGEAEDYYVVVGEGTFGDMTGYVTLFTGGAPVEDAEISLQGEFTDYTTTTAGDGYYLIESILAGTYLATCEKEGYNLISDTVIVEDDVVLSKDYQLTQPTIELSTDNMNVTLAQNTSTSDFMTIENNGDGPLNWSASLAIQSKEIKDYLDLQFEYPTQTAAVESGIETDGEYIYTTGWTGYQIHKYDLEGNLIETFSIDGVSGLRDLAYDGTYFYGSAAIPVVFEMDFQNKVLVSTITVPVNVRAIAYNDNQDVFYSGNWSNEITVFDKSGAMLGSFFTGPVGSVYYGLAYDNVSLGGPYLWGYGAAEGSQNVIVQMQLPSGTETGFYLDLEEILTGPVLNAAGGLYSHPNLVFGKWTLGGIVQNQVMWGLELGNAATWLWVEPNGGTLAPGDNQDLSVTFDATDLPGGVYEADIHFTSVPDVGSPVVNVEMTVTEFFFFPCDFYMELNCMDVSFSWEMCPGGSPDPDSFNIYRNDEWVATTYGKFYTDSLLMPDSAYSYAVSYFLDGLESAAYPVDEITVPLPENLEPENLDFTFFGGEIQLFWETPPACLEPDGYNLYQDGSLLGFTEDTTFSIVPGSYQYMVTAVYYFGESGPSNVILLTHLEETINNTFNVYPNPADNFISVNSKHEILSISLIDHQGRYVIQKRPPFTDLMIDVSDIEKGVYFVVVETKMRTMIQKTLIR